MKKVKSFPDKQKFSKFVTTISALQNCAKQNYSS